MRGLHELTDWRIESITIASDTHLSLRVQVRFDGYGNSIVRYIITKNGKETPYEKYNAAVTAYNLELSR